MEEHIITLLNNNLRVIIPDFGAFIVRQKEPRVIVFNEFLRYNDGLLIEYLAKSEQIDKEIAEQRVADFAEEASKALESGKDFQIKGLGLLTRDPSGKINFTEESVKTKREKPVSEKQKPGKTDESATKEERTKTPVGNAIKKKSDEKPSVAEISPDKSAEKKVEEVKKETKEPVKEKTEKEAAEDLKKKVAERTGDKVRFADKAKPKEEGAEKTVIESKPKQEPKQEPEIQHKPETKTEVKTEPEVKARAETKTTVIPEYKPEKVPVSGKTRKRRYTNQLLVGIVIILFANIIVLAWFLYRDNIKQFFSRKQETVFLTDSTDVAEPVEPAVELTDVDTAPVMEMAAATEETPVAEEPVSLPTQVDQPRFYIVAGCFSEASNADALVQSLRAKGYNAEEFGRIGNLHAVSYAAFDNRTDALHELERIRREEQADAWMTRF